MNRRERDRAPRSGARPPGARSSAPARSGRGPSLWTVLAILALFVVLQHAGGFQAPFFSDDYLFFDKLRGASLRAVWQPANLAYHWYRPWSRELHYWMFLRLFGLNPLPYHLACLALWLATMGLYFAFVARLAGRAVATIATAGVASLAAWIVPLEWAPGAQDLWMLVFALCALHAHARRRPALATAALALALLSKESSAVLPAVALAYSLTVERASAREALRRTAPLLALTAAWAALHPALGGHLWWARNLPALPLVRTSPLESVAKSWLALLNLDLRPAPSTGWLSSLMAAAPGAVVLTLLAVRAALANAPREEEPMPGGTSVASPRTRLLAFGSAWAIAAGLPFLLPSVLWQSYYVALGALGAWIAIAVLIVRVLWLAPPLVLALAILRGARADTPSRDWGNIVLQRFGKSFMGETESYLRRRLPSPPRHTRLYFTTVPRGVVFILGRCDTPALRVWYADTTIVGGFWSDFRPRSARDSIGPDFFFRCDSLAGWVDVGTGPENLERARAANPRWREDHEKLARTFADAGDLRAAGIEYRKLAGADPDRADYAYLLGLCFESLGVRDSAGPWFARAAALPGADAEIRARAGAFARSPRAK